MVQNMRAVRVPSEFWGKISKQICSWSVDTDGNELSEVFKVFVRSGSQPVPSLTWYTELLIYYLANIFSCFSNTFKHFLLYLEGINNRFKENEKICGRDCGDSRCGGFPYNGPTLWRWYVSCLFFLAFFFANRTKALLLHKDIYVKLSHL